MWRLLFLLVLDLFSRLPEERNAFQRRLNVLLQRRERIGDAKEPAGVLVGAVILLGVLALLGVLQLLREVDAGPPRVVRVEGDVEEGGVLLDDGELDLAGLESLREDLHGVDPGEEDAPELALLRRLETDVAAFHLEGSCVGNSS